MNLHHEIENLYLLTSLSKIGKEYWLPESVLAKYFLIKFDKQTGIYTRSTFMNHFSITVLLTYIGSKVRYQKLREFVELHALLKLENVKEHCSRDTESLILMLDLIVCPNVSAQTKQAIATIFGLDAKDLVAVQAATDHWFTAWGHKFDLGMELDPKRSRDVY
jgi:hypothetical protein